MKLLQICSKSPYPPKEGGPIAMNNITQGLIEKGHHVKVLAVSTKKFPVNPENFPKDYIEKTSFDYEYINTSVTLAGAFLNLFSKKSYHISRFYSKKFESKLIRILKENEFDVIQFESLYMSPYVDIVRKYSKAVCVLRAHNIEHYIWKRLAEGTTNPAKKIYLSYLTAKLKHFEINVLEKFNGVAAITNHDAVYFSKLNTKTHIVSIPVGVPMQQIVYSPMENREFPGIFHLGSMDWLPNQEGIRWLINDIWPKVVAKHPDAILHLAGRNMPEWLINAGNKNIKIVGEVNDAISYMNTHAVMVVPLLSGSGMKVKIVEGMAGGNTIITTPIGAEGICVRNEKDILIAKNAEEFAEKISFCITNKDICSKIGFNAYQLIHTKYNNFTITNKLITFYRMLMLNKKRDN